MESPNGIVRNDHWEAVWSQVKKHEWRKQTPIIRIYMHRLIQQCNALYFNGLFVSFHWCWMRSPFVLNERLICTGWVANLHWMTTSSNSIPIIITFSCYHLYAAMSVLMRKYPVSNHWEIITYNMLISNLYASHYLFNHPCSKNYCRYDVYKSIWLYRKPPHI